MIPEALAAWYDYVIVEQKGSAALDEARLSVPIAIVDIDGRTTDFVVVKDQGVVHGASGSLQCGKLDVKQQVANGIQERFDLETLGGTTGGAGGRETKRAAARQGLRHRAPGPVDPRTNAGDPGPC